MKIRTVENPYTKTGYANNMVQVFYAMQQGGYDARIICKPTGTNNIKINSVVVGKDDVDKDTYCLVRAFQPDLFFGLKPRAKKMATHLVLEGDKIPEAWVYVANQADHVWATSNYNRDMLIKNGVVESIIDVIHHGVDQEIFHRSSRSSDGVSNQDSPFTFLFVGGHTIPGDRKGADDLVRAFNQEFKPNEKVKLIIKLNTAYNSPNFSPVEHLRSAGKNDPRITYIIKDMSENERADLYRSSDCYVCPTKGEAFGMTLLESLACGVPVITTAHGGHMDFCNDRNSLLINKWTPWPAHYGIYDIISCSTWVKPDFNELKQKMRMAFEDPKMCKKRGLEGMRLAHDKFTWGHAARKTVGLIEKMWH